jgi:Ca2+:H+ antiporter
MGEFNMRKFEPMPSLSETSESDLSIQSTSSSTSSSAKLVSEGSFQASSNSESVNPLQEDASWGRFLLTFLSLDKIKRRAHREAWGDPANPFSRGPIRANTVIGGADQDVEAHAGLSPTSETLRRLSSEPTPIRTQDLSRGLDDTISPSTAGASTWDEKKQETEPRNINGQAQSSEETAVDRRPTTEGEGPRKRKKGLMGIFRKDKGEESELSPTQTGLSSKSKKSLNHKPFTFQNQLKNTLFNSWINILLIAAPIGIALHFTPVNESAPVAIFVINFIAIIPLAALLSYATEEIALRVGETLGGLLNATFGYVFFFVSIFS